MQENLNVLAIIVRPSYGVQRVRSSLNFFIIKATFIAAVQAQVITYVNQTDSTKLEIASSALFFAGLFLDVLGGCTAYVGSVQLQRIYTLLLRRTRSISAIINTLDQYTLPPPDAPTLDPITDLSLLCLHIQFVEVMFLHALTNLPAWTPTLLKMQETGRSIEDITRRLDKRLHARVCIPLQEYQRTTDELQRLRSEVSVAFSASAALPMIVFAGVICIIVGGLCHVKAAQPVGVWVTSFAVVGVILILCLVMVGRWALMLGTLQS
jgi:hypothetical protein